MTDKLTGQLQRLRHVARIIGPSSAAAQALAEYDRRTAAGEDVTIFERPRSIIVGPSPILEQETEG